MEVMEESVQDTPVSLETPISTVVETPVELPELVYKYQPRDEKGRPLGGAQVIKYRTQEELTEKLVEQNTNLVRALREQTRKRRLGITEEQAVPEEAPRFEQTQLQPRQLTYEERVALSRDLLDPERTQEATDTIVEAALGAKPSVFASNFNELTTKVQHITAKIESDAFMAGTPDYYPCPENFSAIADWMVKNDLAPYRQNFRLAFETLKKDGIMIGKPEEETVVNEVENRGTNVVQPIPVVEVTPTQTNVPVTAPKNVPPASGLTDSGTVVVPKPREKYTLADINKMSGEEYKQRFNHEKGFTELVEKLEAEAASKKRNR